MSGEAVAAVAASLPAAVPPVVPPAVESGAAELGAAGPDAVIEHGTADLVPVEALEPSVAAAVVAEAEAAVAPGPAAVPTPLDLVFRNARTQWGFRDVEVSEETVRTLYDAVKLGPTSGNCGPGRFLFLRTKESRERLRWTLSEGNLAKALAAPLVVVVAHDPKFYEELPRLQPGVDARAWYAHNEELAAVTAFRNGTLQGAYLLMAARAIGLACGPMSGFDNSRVDTEFFIGSGWRSNFLIAMGYPDDAPVAERLPRLAFDEACRLL